jgi:hypothetical protein
MNAHRHVPLAPHVSGYSVSEIDVEDGWFAVYRETYVLDGPGSVRVAVLLRLLDGLATRPNASENKT